MQLLHKANLLVAITIIIFLLFYNVRFLFSSGPQEIGEGSFILTTTLLLQGEDPYALKFMPAFTNIYGPLYHLIVLPFAKIFGPTFTVHRAVSFLFIILTLLVIYKQLKSKFVPTVYALAAVALLYSQIVVTRYQLSSRPDTLGLFLYVSAILLVGKKDCTFKRTAFALILSILSFFSKPYFLLSLPVILINVFLYSRKQFKKAVVFALVTLSLSIIIAHSVFETYLYSVLFTNANSSVFNVEYTIYQLSIFVIWNIGSVLILLMTVSERIKQKMLKLKVPNDTNLVALTFASIVVFFWLGLHLGSYMRYYTHLITPFILLVAIVFLSKIKDQTAKMFYSITLMFNLLFWGYQVVTLPSLPSINQWYKYQKLIAEYVQVYPSPGFSSIAWDLKKTIYDNGQSRDFERGVSFNQKIKLVEGLENRINQHRLEIEQKIRDQDFDLILVENVLPTWPFSRRLLEQTYQKQETLHIDAAYNDWEEEIWVPIVQKDGK